MISIVVPIYNVEKYLNECIESILSQTYKNLEIILVNDGSTDNSREICEFYNKKDQRIKLINKKNGGLSDARNAGLKVAKGDYVSFIDSDDFLIVDTAYEEMYKIAKQNNSDIVAGNALWYYSHDNTHLIHDKEHQFSNNCMRGEEFLKECLKTNRLHAPVCFNLYSRKFLIDNELFFKNGIYHEDEEFTPRALLKCNLVSSYNEPFYAYRQRIGSITNSSSNVKKGIDLLNICLDLDYVLNNISNKELNFLFRKYLVSLSIEQIYKYNLKYVSNDLKNYINKNAVTFGQKIKSILISRNIELFFIFEKCRRKLKKNE